jgi:pimeloyl-ACP methyl ester carboxylesterase
LLAFLMVPGPVARAAHVLPRPFQLDRLNRKLHGRVIDYTHNHGADRRIWSAALGQKRDLYVYLPPGFDPCKLYPVIVVLHGFLQDEKAFLDWVVPLDRAISCGELPPVILAAPDGSVHGVTCVLSAGTFFLNSKLGRFEDYLAEDVWNFLVTHYPIRPEREAHVLLGVSMGGGAAFNHAIKYRERFGVVAGVFPPLNSRWISCRGKYMDDFDPCCWGWRTDFTRGHEVLGRLRFVPVRMRRVIYPLYGRDNDYILAKVSSENPIEMLDSYHVRPGEIEMFVAYAGKDELNLDAQAESFLYRARERGLTVGVAYAPNGRHNERTGLKLLPCLLGWLRPRLEPYSPH